MLISHPFKFDVYLIMLCISTDIKIKRMSYQNKMNTASVEEQTKLSLIITTFFFFRMTQRLKPAIAHGAVRLQILDLEGL